MSGFQEFVRSFQDHPMEDVVRIGKRYFYDPEGLSDEIKEKGWEVTSLGIFLGEEKTRFRPSPALLDLLETDRKVIIDDKAAEQFLYGKDVLMKGVVREGAGMVFVHDEAGNVLGYGKTVNQYNKDAPDRVFVKNILDRSDYLHRES